MEEYFKKFRNNTIGVNSEYENQYGKHRIIYADWIASGRLYQPIEQKIAEVFGPYVANTHTETSETGTRMTHAYHQAKKIIRQHIHANENDVILTPGFGMTGAVNKFMRILGLKPCSRTLSKDCLPLDVDRPVVFVTHMEHHSNHTAWYETLCEVVIVPPSAEGLVDLEILENTVKKYQNRNRLIGSFTACSNVTGITTPYHQMAAIMHKYKGLCFVDFAASAPYVDINMHPEKPMEALDAIFFSPHKFLGGPGSSSVLAFNKNLYLLKTPDQPGGGTVDWTNAWGEYKYTDDIEAREDGGTPGFLQAIRTALCIKLKEEMNPILMQQREHQIIEKVFHHLSKIQNLKILANNVRNRLGSISFYIEGIHYNLIVKLLSDRFGIQVRGGCACAGTYGHLLLDVTYEESKRITSKIDLGDLSEKPGWVRLSIHPTMTDEEVDFICDAIGQIQANATTWVKDYDYNCKTNEFTSINTPHAEVSSWFEF
jgi:selenocysteine lyase/cysteine desulfurase